MATKKFIIEMEEGNTLCGDCLLREVKDCIVAARLFIPAHNTCWNLNLATIKIKELEETDESKS